MILITVGTQKFPLNRLFKQIDTLIESGDITEEVFAQIGNADYEPKHYKFKRFMNKDEFEKAITECSLLITHGGVGSIIKGLTCNKPVIVFPRLARFGEHVDDHQIEISIAFEQLNYVLCCEQDDNLLNVINEAKTHKFEKYQSGNHSVISTIKDYLMSI